MADERYQWLDQEAAERILRGLPVDAVDDHVREQAERLAQFLEAARTGPPASGRAPATELPGEAAALAAFRQARAGRAGPAVSASPSPAARRWGRSLRYGLAAAVAAVAVGGVAVASGTGMLPLPFDRAPAPAGSVTALDSAPPHVSGDDPDHVHPEPGMPSASPGTDVPPPGSSSSAEPTPSPSDTAESDGPGGKGDATPEPKKSTGGADKDSVAEHARTIQACQDFRAGRLAASDRKQLESEARSGETLRRYCDRVLASVATGSGGSSGAPGSATPGRTPGGTPGGDSSGGGDEDKGEGDRGGNTSGSGDAKRNGNGSRNGSRAGAGNGASGGSSGGSSGKGRQASTASTASTAEPVTSQV